MTQPTDRVRTIWAVFRTLSIEEWRLHTRLFGGWRFVGFPVGIAALAVAATVALLETATAFETIVLGVHVLVFGFGLYSGTAGFAGSDMLENVFGELTLLLSSVETLPLSRRGLLGLFLLKDGLFYALVFVLPVAMVALVPTEGAIAALIATGELWLSLSIVFAVGMVMTVGMIAIRTRGVPAWVILAVVVVAVGAWFFTDGALESVVSVPVTDTPAVAGSLVAGTVLTGALSLAVYDPTYGRPERTATDRFARVADALPLEGDALVAKSLLDLARSSGGVWKPFVSAAVLVTVVAALVGVVREITGIEPAPGIFFGGVLGLAAFTTYNWLTQFDSLEAYLVYPVSVEDVFRAKRTAFLLVGTPAVAMPYLGAVVVFRATAIDAIVGAALLAGYGLYYYGLTVYVAGFDPNEFLFDIVRFGLFSVGVAIALGPTLVAGFVVVPPTPTVAVVLLIAAFGFGAVGYLLSSRAGPRWDRRYRG